jgi:ABC-type antimicrobial peptide transport system permease subunit
MVRRALGPVAVGLALGIAFALALGRVLASVLFGVGGADPVTFAGGVGILAAATLLASVIPALRAARVDPVVALRAE